MGTSCPATFCHESFYPGISYSDIDVIRPHFCQEKQGGVSNCVSNPGLRISTAKCICGRKVPKIKQKALKSEDSSAKCWSCWADSNRRPHPYQKAIDAFVLCPFIPIKTLHSLVLQRIGGFSAVEKFYWIPIWIMWI